MVSIFQQINSQQIILHHPAPLKANFLFYIQKSNFFSSPYFSESDQLSLFPIVIGLRNKFTRPAVVRLIRLFKLWFLNVVTINVICCLPSATSHPQLPIFAKRTTLQKCLAMQAKFTRSFRRCRFRNSCVLHFQWREVSIMGHIYDAYREVAL